jgi:error-prone DNA polymerase
MPELPDPKFRVAPEPPTAVVPAAEPYAELDVVSNFSFLRGASHPDELVFRAAELGYRAIAVADHNTLAGVVRAHEAAAKCGLKLIVGARLVLQDGPDLIVWCADRPAYARLCRLLTQGKRRAEKGGCALWLNDVLPALAEASGLLAGIVPAHPFDPDLEPAIGRLLEAAGGHSADRLSIATSCLYDGTQATHLRDLAGLSRATGIPLVATNGVHYHTPDRRPLQDVMTCVRHGCTIHDAGYRLFPNGERYLKSPAQMWHVFAGMPGALRRTVDIANRCTFRLDELKYEYPDELVPPGRTPAEHLRELAEQGAAARYPDGVPSKVQAQIEHELTLIAQLQYEAYFLTVHDLVLFARSQGILCQGRGSAANSAVCWCLGITNVDPNKIDLLFERFVSASRKEPPDIDVDFEHERREEVLQYLYRKYGRQRVGMTGVVTTYRGRSAVRDVGKALGLSLDLVDQLSKRLEGWHAGAPTETQLAELGLDPADPTLRQVIALTSELLGFPRHLSQHVGGMVMTRGPLCEMVPIENASMDDRTVIEWDKDDIDTLGILKVDVLALGMLTCISKAFELIDRSLALHTIPHDDPAVYDMICRADTVGVFQIESRAQMSMLPRLRPRCFYDLVIEVAIVRPGPIQGNMVHPYLRRRNGEEPVTYPSEALQNVLKKTLGVPLFQEQAMKVVMVAAGFSADEAEQLRKAMAAWRKTSALEKFQDKVIQGMLSNGYDRTFAEQMFEQIRGFGEYGFPESHAASFAHLVYVSCWLKRHHPAAFAAALLNSQPMGFYAPAQVVRDAIEHGVEVRAADVNVSGWECSLETEKGAEAQEGTEAQRHIGTKDLEEIESERRRPSSAAQTVDPSCLCASVPSCLPSSSPSTWGHGGPAIRLGLRMIKGLRADHAAILVDERQRRGPFVSIQSLFIRTGLPRPTLRRLAEADAFQSLGLKRREAIWQVLGLQELAPLFEHEMGKDGEGTKARRHGGTEGKTDIEGHAGSEDAERFTSEGRHSTDVAHLSSPSCLRGSVPPCLPPPPCLPSSPLPPMPIGQEVMTDYATAGLSLKAHPVGLVRDVLRQRRIITAAELKQTAAGRWVRVAGLVLVRQRPGTASGIVFETLEDETGIANLIVRPAVYDRYKAAARYSTLVEAQGIVERQGDVIHVMVKKMEDLTYLVEGLSNHSRDFH